MIPSKTEPERQGQHAIHTPAHVFCLLHSSFKYMKLKGIEWNVFSSILIGARLFVVCVIHQYVT